MKVYTISYHNYDEHHFYGIFSTKEKAKKINYEYNLFGEILEVELDTVNTVPCHIKRGEKTVVPYDSDYKDCTKVNV